MKNLSRLFVIALLLMVVAVLVAPVAAQEEGAGEGGVILLPNISDDPASFNPIIGNDTASSEVYQYLYPAIIGISPSSGAMEPNLDAALATGWEYDETGTVLTITLREDAMWNDGTPITSADYLWSVNAIRSGTTTSPRTSMFATLADGTPSSGPIVDVQAIDEYTVQVTFAEPDCNGLEYVNDATVVPAHVFGELYGEDYALMDEDPRGIPTVTFGPFKDIEFDPGQRVSMIADQSYPDTQLGYVSPSEWVYLSVPDTTVAVERFIAGDLTYMGIPSERQGEFRGNADFQIYETTQNGFQYMGFNFADPSNPQPGLDESGNVIDQGHHPIFGDVNVRRAIAHAIDKDAIIAGVLNGNGLRIDTHTIPTSWVQADVETYDFDLDVAAAMLDEAGWVDDDANNSTPRICQGCMYAEEGAPLVFSLQTNAGNVARERIGEIIQSQLSEVGIQVNFEAIDFSTLVDNLTAQTFDAIIIGWSLGLPINPDVTDFYTPEVDLPGSGFGFTSMNNEELNTLLKLGRNPAETENCSIEGRAPIYERVQQILAEELPYVYLYVGNVMTASQNYVENFDPLPFNSDWNIDAWVAVQD